VTVNSIQPRVVLASGNIYLQI